MDTKGNISRRDILKLAISAIGSFIGAALGLPAIAYIIGPAKKSDDSQNRIRLGPLSKIEIGTPSLFKPKVERQNGWIVDEEELGIYVLTDDGQNYLAMSNICTHLGCRVRWIEKREQFLSPCHNGVFDKFGYVVSGPPPRPLDIFQTKVENGEIFIQLPVTLRSVA
jgi:menaquinol-cytochrome c reductase iron-sulfur subunit